MADREARATWQGDLLHGSGEVELRSSGASAPLAVSWPARSEATSGGKTSPEELIAAAHASCFNMALANTLAQQGTPARSLETEATCTFVVGKGITTMHLRVTGEVDGVDEDGFRRAADQAKQTCPVSGALAGNVDVSVSASLR